MVCQVRGVLGCKLYSTLSGRSLMSDCSSLKSDGQTHSQAISE